MLSKTDRLYLISLSRIKNIRSILDAFAVNDPALDRFLQQTSSPQRCSSSSDGGSAMLDTKYSNIRGDRIAAVKQIIPPDVARQFQNHDEITSRLAAIYSAEGSLKYLKKASRIHACQQAHMLFLGSAPEGGLQTCILPYACNSRCCPICSRVKSEKTFARAYDTLLEIFERRQTDVRWIVLTIQNPPEGDLDLGIKDILKAFRRLRRPREMNGRRGLSYNCWTEHVDGYIWNLEITHNLEKRSWHPHIHILYGGDFIHWSGLQKEWNRALSPFARIGGIKIKEAYWKDSRGEKHSLMDSHDPVDAIAILKEVCKYTLKPFESHIPKSCILELTEAVFNKRLFGSGGDWRLPPAQARNVDASWILEGGLKKVIDEDPDFWSDKDYQKSILKSCSTSLSMWLRIVRNYDLYYQIQKADSQSPN